MNDNFDNFDEPEKLTSSEILQSEHEILDGLLALGTERENEANYEQIRVERHGKVHLIFRVRPISDDEYHRCVKRATYTLPKKSRRDRETKEVNHSMLNSHVIYTATVDADRMKVWENRTAQEKLGVMQGVELIDKILLMGEKERILEVIERISGFGDESATDDAEDLAGNS